MIKKTKNIQSDQQSDDDFLKFQQQKLSQPIPSQQLTISYKPNHYKLPILILPDHRLLVYTSCPLYPKIYSHLISFSQPIYRPHVIHQYKITKFSLYTAMVLHYSGQQIIQILKLISKNLIFPIELMKQIKQYMKYAGQVRFHLIKQKYYLYTNKQIGKILEKYLKYQGQIDILQEEKYFLNQIHFNLHKNDYYLPGQIQMKIQNNQQEQQRRQQEYQRRHQQSQFNNNQSEMLSFSQQQNNLQTIQQRKKHQKRLSKYLINSDYFIVTRLLIQRNIPIVQQFDYLHSPDCPNIPISMITDLTLRYYQQRALKNVFIQNLARSGIIILPCGAGKSLVAISIIAKIKKNAVIFCQSQVSAQQWRNQLLKWTTIDRDKIVILSAKKMKQKNPKKIRQCAVLITTYAMVGMKRVVENKFLLESQQISWGVCIADEVHKLPAETFQLVLRNYKFYLKIGLTATPYRQDQKINNLFFMIGPKLYEQNWLDLVEQGCLAKPYCVEILCQMPQLFILAYQKTNSSQLIHTANPQKFKALQYLLKKHSFCHDKILVFCDRPKVLQYYAKKLKMPYIHGQVSQQQRVKIYNLFKTTKDINILFLSRVGDTAIDLPCANVGIQLGMHYKSRRQQVQRMGRIMRAKDNPNNEFNAFFYSLVSINTKQVLYSRKRQKCLVDQGFQYQIILQNKLNYDGMKLQNLDEKQFLLKLLSEHQEGEKYLIDKKQPEKIKKQIIKGNIKQQMDNYYYQEQEEDSQNQSQN